MSALIELIEAGTGKRLMIEVKGTVWKFTVEKVEE